MKPENTVKLTEAQSLLTEALRKLDSIVNDEWESMDDSDIRTEEQIDQTEAIGDALRKQQAAIMQLLMQENIHQVAQDFPNAMRMLADD